MRRQQELAVGLLFSRVRTASQGCSYFLRMRDVWKHQAGGGGGRGGYAGRVGDQEQAAWLIV